MTRVPMYAAENFFAVLRVHPIFLLVLLTGMRHNVPMYVETVPNRNSHPTILLREAHREGKRVVKRTLANLTSWPRDKVEMLRRVLRNEKLAPMEEVVEIIRTLPLGHVAAVLGTLKRLGLHRLLDRRAHRHRQMVMAMIVARILNPCSKLATARELNEETATSTLAEELGIPSVDEDELYGAMDWLLAQQPRIEKSLFRRHLRDGMLVLYDVTSSYFEGRKCPLARYGHSRDKRSDRLQIVYGLLCDSEGRPLAVEVFEGNTGDPGTLGAQVEKIRKRFGIDNIVLVGDRGMITAARIREDLKPNGLDWITALRSPSIRKLCDQRAVQMSFFDDKDLMEIRHPDYPGERLVVCRNAALAEERRRKREELLVATEERLEKIAVATRRSRKPLRGTDKIGIRAGGVLEKSKVKKHFSIRISDTEFHHERDQERIEREAALDGLYVIRTSVKEDRFDAENTVRAYKDLSRVERAFRTFKGIDLQVRPIFHRLADRVRAHVFLCMLAYYVEWHMRRALASVLFQESDPDGAAALRDSIVAPAVRSEETERKARTRRTEDDFPVHSFRTLLSDLKTIAKNQIKMGGVVFDRITTPTAFQQKVFNLLEVTLRT